MKIRQKRNSYIRAEMLSKRKNVFFIPTNMFIKGKNQLTMVCILSCYKDTLQM